MPNKAGRKKTSSAIATQITSGQFGGLQHMLALNFNATSSSDTTLGSSSRIVSTSGSSHVGPSPAVHCLSQSAMSELSCSIAELIAKATSPCQLSDPESPSLPTVARSPGASSSSQVPSADRDKTPVAAKHYVVLLSSISSLTSSSSSSDSEVFGSVDGDNRRRRLKKGHRAKKRHRWARSSQAAQDAFNAVNSPLPSGRDCF
ncbi:uncharacterized protein LOC121933098 [Sceloporus undulatus]|uniref:uncharacterized protein LOC121933098 n=1 Tax=Sceloporus undulatus TaxID=8520 RepID=UPI001C4B2E41|nr:uncharacterized protein LOC121933098 [Sceloporus undulatus]